MSNAPPPRPPRSFLAGLSHTPRSEKTEISFSMGDPSSYEVYVESINKFLKLYEDDIQTDLMKYEDCGGKFFFVFVLLPY